MIQTYETKNGHKISNCALSHSDEFAWWRVICKKCGKIMVNHDVWKTPCNQDGKKKEENEMVNE
jgi:hypothetical protein